MVIFTDLDGTLLDRQTYSYQKAEPALDLIKKRGIPLIFCSAKTRAEQEVYRKKLDLHDPFIVEDGGAVFVGNDYFPFQLKHDRSIDDYRVIEIGTSYTKIREILPEVAAETGLTLKGYGDMNINEVVACTGLEADAAVRAMAREYEETLVTKLRPGEAERLRAALARRGLTLSHGGRFYGVMGSNDKGKAVSLLTDLYRRQHDPIWTVGIGDSQNDTPLLSAVDFPVLVQKANGDWENIKIPRLRRVEGIGSIGWNRFVLELLS